MLSLESKWKTIGFGLNVFGMSLALWRFQWMVGRCHILLKVKQLLSYYVSYSYQVWHQNLLILFSSHLMLRYQLFQIRTGFISAQGLKKGYRGVLCCASTYLYFFGYVTCEMLDFPPKACLWTDSYINKANICHSIHRRAQIWAEDYHEEIIVWRRNWSQDLSVKRPLC